MKQSDRRCVGVAMLGLARRRRQAQNEQFIPMAGYWVGPYAAGGSGIFGGFIDYMNMINARDGGINGVKLTWEKCETEYNNARGVECYERLKNKGPTGASVFHIAVDRHHLLADREGDRRQDPGDLDRLRPHRRLRRPRLPVRLPAGHQLLVAEHRQDQVHRHEGRRDGQAQGQEDREHLSRLGLRQGDDPGPRRAGEEVRLRASRTSRCRIRATSRQSQWLQIRQIKPDWVILRGWGVMNPMALKTAAEGRLPARPHRRRAGGPARRRTRFRRATRPRATSRPASTSRAPTSRWSRRSRSTSTPRARARWRTSRASARSTTTAASSTASSPSRRSAPRRRSSARSR